MKYLTIHTFERSERRFSNLLLVRDDQESLNLSRDLADLLFFAVENYEDHVKHFLYSSRSGIDKIVEIDICVDHDIECIILEAYGKLTLNRDYDTLQLIAILIETAVLDELENDTEDLYENCDGEKVPYDDLSDAEQDFYDRGLNNEMDYDINNYCQGYYREDGTDWGSGADGELTEEDYEG